MKHKLLSLCICLSLILTIAVTPATALNINSPTLNLADGIVLSDTATSIEETGENLVASQPPISTASALSDNVTIAAASIQNEEIHFIGSANNTPFNISGAFCSISENGNVVVFNATDNTNNFRVVYCAVEKELDKAALYFDSFANANPEYDVVTKLYLAPNSDVHGQYIMTELYSNEFPSISSESIAALPEDHQLNLFWYAKEFKPTSTEEQTITTRAGNPTYILTELYTYNHLGITCKHWLQYEEQCDIRDTTHEQASTASATLKVTKKWVDADFENAGSSTYSTLSIRYISIGYFTMPGTAVTQLMSNGNTTRAGVLQFDYKFKIGVNIRGLSIPTTAYLSWTPGTTDYKQDVYHEIHTNSGENYWRDAIAEINSSYYLDVINNHINVFWSYASYFSTPSSGVARLVFKFGINNELDYTQYKPVEHIRSITVNVT